jgi:hypothetical protein
MMHKARLNIGRAVMMRFCVPSFIRISSGSKPEQSGEKVRLCSIRGCILRNPQFLAVAALCNNLREGLSVATCIDTLVDHGLSEVDWTDALRPGFNCKSCHFCGPSPIT